MVKNIYKYLKIYEDFGSKSLDLLRYIFSFLALTFVIIELKQAIGLGHIETLKTQLTVHFELVWLFGTFVFAFIHHWSDAKVWQSIIATKRKFPLLLALRMNWTSLAYSFYSPNRLLDIPSKVLLLEDMDRAFKWYAAGLYNVLKPSATFYIGLAALSLLLGYWWLTLGLVIVGPFVLLWIKDKLEKSEFLRDRISLEERVGDSLFLELLGLNLIRIVSLALQHAGILFLLGFQFPVESLLMYLLIIHTVVTFLPQVAGTEIFVRSYLCFYFLELDSGHELVLASSVLVLWTMNIMLPAVIGLFVQKKAGLKKD